MGKIVSGTPFVIRPRVGLLERYPWVRHASADLSLKYAFHDVVTDEALENMGALLWNALVADDPELAGDFAQARQAAGLAILCVVIESDDPAIQHLPWEALYHPDYAFLGKSPAFTLLRQLPTRPTTLPAPEAGPLRVLLFTSLPDDLDAEHSRLSVEEQQALVLEALASLVNEGVVQLEMPDDGRFATLKQLLGDFQPHLLFLFGHGKFYDAPHMEEPPYAIFQFEADDGRSDLVRDEEIAQAFFGSSVQGIVLSACESGQGSSLALTQGLMWRLSQMGVPHVIGMRESVLERAGILFNQALCRALAQKERIDVALQQARQAITTPLRESIWLKNDAAGVSEMSLGQWCLPALVSQNAAQPLITWTFTPRPQAQTWTNQTLEQISLPPRFVGRRSELRDLKSRWRRGGLRQLLITGPGGQGKTALAGKLAQDLQRRGYTVFAWSAGAEGDWDAFMLEMELTLSPTQAERYTRGVGRLTQEADRIKLLLRLLLAEQERGVVLFFDNLEAVQDAQTLALTDERLRAWLAAAQSVAGPRLILLLTSRWRWPAWPEADHWPLRHAGYGDFLQMALLQNLPPAFLRERKRLREVHRVLHGNGRGLHFFAAAMRNMDAAEEEAFLRTLDEANAELQTNMALARIVAHLNSAERDLLARLRAYQTPVPAEGVVKIGLDLPAPEQLLQRLLAVSLVERQYHARWQVHEYQLPHPVVTWLEQQGVPPVARAWRLAAAAYLDYVYRRERPETSQALLVHQAWQAAGEQRRADRLALDHIVGALNRAGLYQTLLKDWLPLIRDADDPRIKAEALGQTGKQYIHLGDYDTALAYLQQSLQIWQEIGDKAGLCATLFNMGHIHRQNGSIQEAVGAWVTVYVLAKKIRLAQALQALAQLAPQLGLPDGLEGWEMLARQFGNGE